MKHEVLFLNSRRAYVRVGETWYDNPKDAIPQIGEAFLTGRVEEVLDYETYIETYPESKDELYPYVSDKTNHGGWIRRVVDGMVKYAVNPDITTINNSVDTESILN